jgi:hypothetical protein
MIASHDYVLQVKIPAGFDLFNLDISFSAINLKFIIPQLLTTPQDQAL